MSDGGSPSGNISLAEVKAALMGAAEWGVGGFAGTFGMGLLQNPRPDLRTLAENAAVVAISGFLLRVARVFGTNTVNGKSQ